MTPQCVTAAPPARAAKGYLRTCLTPSFSSETTGVIRASAQRKREKKKRLIVVIVFHVQFISTNSVFENDEGPGAAQLRWERGTWHLMFISHKRRNGTFYLSVLQCKNRKGGWKKKPREKDKQRLHFKRTAVAGSGCVLPVSFRNNKHSLLTWRRRGGTAATRTARASQGSLKESGEEAGGGVWK